MTAQQLRDGVREKRRGEEERQAKSRDTWNERVKTGRDPRERGRVGPPGVHRRE